MTEPDVKRVADYLGEKHGDDAVTMTRLLIEILDALRRIEDRLRRLDPNPVPSQPYVQAARR